MTNGLADLSLTADNFFGSAIMVLQNDICTVTISIDETYTVDSMDNKPYDLVLNSDGLKSNDIYKVLSIQIDLYQKVISIALIGDYCTYDTDCAILEGVVLTILQNDTIFQLNVNNGSMILFKELDCFGCNFGIYKVKSGYIIYGEIEIIMLDFDFNKKWSFSGRDIFVSVSGKESFKLCENSIKLYDFEDNFYEIDFTGNLISQT